MVKGQVFHRPRTVNLRTKNGADEMARACGPRHFICFAFLYGVGIVACTWFEKLLSVPLESTAVVT